MAATTASAIVIVQGSLRRAVTTPRPFTGRGSAKRLVCISFQGGRNSMDPIVANSRHPIVHERSSSTTLSPRVTIVTAIGAVLALFLPCRPVHADSNPLRPFLPLQVSTVPANGDLNPYGLAFVPHATPFPSAVPTGGALKPGVMLISNFNDTSLQGRGSTIITIDPDSGETGLFFQGTPPIGFTNALGVVRAGLVFAGSVFTTDGTSKTAGSGGLYVLDARGHIVTKLGTSKLINGPWGLAINDRGFGAQLFVSNVFDGTVTRLDVTFENGGLTVRNSVEIGSGYGFGPDSAAVVVGPAGLAYDPFQDILFVASEMDDTIFALHAAGHTQTDLGKGAVVYQDAAHLHGPLGLILSPNGNLLVANADPAVSQDPTEPSEIVEFTRDGRFVREYSVDPNLGSAFALGIAGHEDSEVFAYVDDFLSTCTILNLSAERF